MPQHFPLVIAGGNSLIAPFILKRLQALGLVAEVISRRPVAVPEGFIFTQMDLTLARNWIAPENAVVISLLPLSVLAQFLPRFIGVKSIEVVSPVSYHHPASDTSSVEAHAARMALSEDVLVSWCKRSNVQYSLLRTAMTYDCIHDSNVTRMARFIRRYRFLPLAPPGKGLRQPIHADDVAKAVIAGLNNEQFYGKAVNIAGGEILSYRRIAERVFAALGITPRFVPVPTGWLEKGLGWLSRTSLANLSFSALSDFHDMNRDMIVDTTEGLRLLDYQPRKLELDFSPVSLILGPAGNTFDFLLHQTIDRRWQILIEPFLEQGPH